MQKKSIKYIIGGGVLVLLIFSYYDFNISLLLFFLFFQTMSILGIVNSIRTYRKTKNGNYVEGEIKDIRKIKSNEDDVHNYEYTIDFYWPIDNKKYQLKYKSSDWTKSPVDKKYKIWVDETDPTKSVVMQSFGGHWWYSIIFFIIVIIGLCVADFILLKRIIN